MDKGVRDIVIEVISTHYDQPTDIQMSKKRQPKAAQG